jgi:hypothetical protein
MGTSPKKPKKPEAKKPAPKKLDDQPKIETKQPAPPPAAAMHPPVKTTLPAGIPPNISNMFGSKSGKGPRFTPTKGRNFRHQGR